MSLHRHNDETEASAAHEAQLGDWPRRLLHVPTMTSHTWQPGNKYGSVANPRYNALSYTWGRWALKSGYKPHIAALEIDGVTWNVPRIDHDEHFSVAQFKYAIQEATQSRVQVAHPTRVALKHSPLQASKGVQASPPKEVDDDTAVEFLWLDVACIDQRSNTVKLAEIGRQAQIFEHASTVYIWLSHSPTPVLEATFQGLERTVDLINEVILGGWGEHGRRVEPEHSWVPEIGSQFQVLRDDPWFTSLWTLQEAFLCKNAVILSKEGHSLKAGFDDGLARLTAISQVGSNVVSFLEDMRQRIDDPIYAVDPVILCYLEEHAGIIRKLGLDGIATSNPTTLYTTARHRTASLEHDYIYGIMQVFRLRIGHSRLGADPTHVYELTELEDELGEALMQKDPVLSQMHMHTKWPRELGKGWRISRTSAPTGLNFDYSMHKESLYETLRHSTCKMSCSRSNNQLWGQFEGRVCSFEVLYKAWMVNDALDSAEAAIDEESIGEKMPYMHIALDVCPDIFPDPSVFRNPKSGHLDERQQARWLAGGWGEDSQHFKVLHLGIHSKRGTFTGVINKDHCGLLLLWTVTPSVSYWRRVGVCTWGERPLKDNADGLYGIAELLQPPPQSRSDPGPGHSELCSFWQYLDGLFG